MSPVTYTKKDIDELIRTLRGYDGVPGVMERLTRLETLIEGIDTWVKAQQQSKPEQKNSNDQLVSWSWIRDKIVQPSLMLFIGWFLFSFIPNMLSK